MELWFVSNLYKNLTQCFYIFSMTNTNQEVIVTAGLLQMVTGFSHGQIEGWEILVLLVGTSMVGWIRVHCQSQWLGLWFTALPQLVISLVWQMTQSH